MAEVLAEVAEVAGDEVRAFGGDGGGKNRLVLLWKAQPLGDL